MDDEEEFDLVQFVSGLGESESRRFRKVDLLVFALDGMSNFLSVLSSSATTAYNLAARHANWLSEQEDFATEAAVEIETLTSGEPEDG